MKGWLQDKQTIVSAILCHVLNLNRLLAFLLIFPESAVITVCDHTYLNNNDFSNN